MNTQNHSNRPTVRNLAIFTIVVITIGWLGHGLDVLMGNPALESLGMLLWIIAPLGTSLLLRTFAGDGFKDFGLKLHLKGNVVWYGASLVLYPVVTVCILLIGSGSGLITFSGFSFTTSGLFLQAFALGLLPMFLKNIFEEFAWRGYLAPKVYSLHLNDYVGHLLVGLVWGVWHIPYYLFFLDRAVIQDYTSLDLPVFIPLAIVVIISYALVYGEIRLLTNSVWPAVLIHMVEDAFVNPLLLDGYIRIKPGMDILVSPGVSIISIILFSAIGVGLRQLRKRKQKGNEFR